MKVKITGTDRETRRDMIEALCSASGAELVQAVGHIALIYREAAG
jgi:RNA-binding protein